MVKRGLIFDWLFAVATLVTAGAYACSKTTATEPAEHSAADAEALANAKAFCGSGLVLGPASLCIPLGGRLAIEGPASYSKLRGGGVTIDGDAHPRGIEVVDNYVLGGAYYEVPAGSACRGSDGVVWVEGYTPGDDRRLVVCGPREPR